MRLCVQQQSCTTFGDMVFSFDSILAFWMRDWLDYKYTYIDDGRSIRLYYPTRSKHSKAKWWIGFFYYVFRCQQFYVHSIILLFFYRRILLFFSSHFWIIVFALLLLNTSMCWHYRFAFYNWFFLQSEIRQEYTTPAFLFIYDFRCVVNMLECHPNCKTECASLFIYFFFCIKNSMQVFSWMFFVGSLIFGSLVPAQTITLNSICILCIVERKILHFFFSRLPFITMLLVWMRPCKDTTFQKREFSYSYHRSFHHSHKTYI